MDGCAHSTNQPHQALCISSSAPYVLSRKPISHSTPRPTSAFSHVAVQQCRNSFATRQSLPWPHLTALAGRPGCAIDESRHRGAAPYRPIRRMLPRAVFRPVTEASIGVIESQCNAFWRTWGHYLSTSPFSGNALSAPWVQGSVARVRLCSAHVVTTFTSPRQRTSVHHSQAPPAALLPANYCLSPRYASTPWLCTRRAVN